MTGETTNIVILTIIFISVFTIIPTIYLLSIYGIVASGFGWFRGNFVVAIFGLVSIKLLSKISMRVDGCK